MSASRDYSSDRFIPLRGSCYGSVKVSHNYPSPVQISCRDYCKDCNSNDTNENFMQYLFKKNKYKDVLMETLFDNPRRALYFSPKQKSMKSYSDSKSPINMVEDWPVKARRMPLISSTSTVLDIPDIASNNTGTNQRIDWGASGYIAVVHEDTIVAHHPDQNVKFVIKLDHDVGGVKWNLSGTRLAIIGEQSSKLFLWDVELEKVISSISMRITGEKISCIAFTSRLVILGSSKGTLYITSQNLDNFKTVRNIHAGLIFTAKVSCNERFLATSGNDCYVTIWDLPHCISFYNIDCTPSSVLSLDWHPWKEPLLVLGTCGKDSFCTLWDYNKPDQISLTDCRNPPIVDCLSFNPNSAELVVSFHLNPPEESRMRHSIVVQCNKTTVVDDIKFHNTRSPYLLWDARGERLATVGYDENLVIWDFFGKERKIMEPKKLFNNSTSLLDKMTIR